MTTDIGDVCVECRGDTSFGSGLFVNRIPAGTDTEVGYLCAECQLVECWRCEEMVEDRETQDDGSQLCIDCIERDETKEKNR